MTTDKGPRGDRWYLALMAPNTKGEKFAWLDPTSIYINAAAFSDLLDDLTGPLAGHRIDVVGGLDAMGFVLGAGIAARLGTGFLPIRKAGKLCVDTDRVEFSNYSGRTQGMEMRNPAFALVSPERSQLVLEVDLLRADFVRSLDVSKPGISSLVLVLVGRVNLRKALGGPPVIRNASVRISTRLDFDTAVIESAAVRDEIEHDAVVAFAAKVEKLLYEHF